MPWDLPGDGRVPWKAREGIPELVDRGEDVVRRSGVHAQMQVEDVHRLEVGDLEEERLLTHCVHRLYGNGVVPRRVGMAGGELAGAVSRAVAVVPGLGEVARPLPGDRGVERQRERHADPVLVRVEL